MDSLQKLIQALATLLWPVIVIILLVLLRPAIQAVADSARSRKFTLKVGGQELTMEEASAVQQKLFADLQSKVAELEKTLLQTPVTVSAALPAVATNHHAILWVDDNPKNNSYFIQHLREVGSTVDVVTSTTEGMSYFSTRKYDLVLTDMGRLQDEGFHPTAGLELIKAIRRIDTVVPIVVHCSAKALQQYGAQALDLGATAVTSSPTELAGLLNL